MFLSIAKNKNENQLITNRELIKEEIILNFKGDITSQPSKYSIQIGKNEHLDVPERKMGTPDYYWAFLNHSCAPNTYIKNKRLIALTDIPAGTELTFNYNTTEYDMATPFTCNCQDQNCLKEIKGYKYLTNSEKEAIKNYTASYLKAFISQ
ncbi:MAG: SET domain-containing protein-lysine N-methyltransferase [Vicingus serpentipes]|nr:SET domain-containing protein-lysine N-methyltransferase [Vicingus serpentipes]